MDEHRENCKTETKNIRQYEIEVTDLKNIIAELKKKKKKKQKKKKKKKKKKH